MKCHLKQILIAFAFLLAIGSNGALADGDSLLVITTDVSPSMGHTDPDARDRVDGQSFCSPRQPSTSK